MEGGSLVFSQLDRLKLGPEWSTAVEENIVETNIFRFWSYTTLLIRCQSNQRTVYDVCFINPKQCSQFQNEI